MMMNCNEFGRHLINFTDNKKEAARHAARVYSSSILEGWMEQAVLCEFEVSMTFIASSRTTQVYIVRLHLKTEERDKLAILIY